MCRIARVQDCSCGAAQTVEMYAPREHYHFFPWEVALKLTVHRYGIVHYSTVQYSIVQYSVVQYHFFPWEIALKFTVHRCSTV